MAVDIDKVVARGKNIAARYRGRKYMSWAKSEAMVRDLLAALEQSQKHDRDYAKCECGCIVNVQHNNRPICAKCGKTAELICIEIELVKALQRVKELEVLLLRAKPHVRMPTVNCVLDEQIQDALSRKDGK